MNNVIKIIIFLHAVGSMSVFAMIVGQYQNYIEKLNAYNESGGARLQVVKVLIDDYNSNPDGIIPFKCKHCPFRPRKCEKISLSEILKSDRNFSSILTSLKNHFLKHHFELFNNFIVFKSISDLENYGKTLLPCVKKTVIEKMLERYKKEQKGELISCIFNTCLYTHGPRALSIENSVKDIIYHISKEHDVFYRNMKIEFKAQKRKSDSIDDPIYEKKALRTDVTINTLLSDIPKTEDLKVEEIERELIKQGLL